MKQSNIIGNKKIRGNRKEQFIKDLKFSYDTINDLFYAYKKGSQVYSNVIIGEFHLEFDKKRELVGIEILKASEILSEYGISRDIIKNINKIELKIVTKNNSLLIFLMLSAKNEEKSATITLNNLDSPIMKIIAST